MAQATPSAEDDHSGKATARPAGKGKPTPKRSESERRRQPYGVTGPDTGRKGRKGRGQSRDRVAEREARRRRYEAQRRGEEWALNPGDRGPARALARDYIDSRRTIAEYMVYIAIALIVIFFVVASFDKKVVGSSGVLYIEISLLAILWIESRMHGNKVIKMVRERYPKESTRGLRMYVFARSVRVRRTRIPLPRVKPGDQI